MLMHERSSAERAIWRHPGNLRAKIYTEDNEVNKGLFGLFLVTLRYLRFLLLNSTIAKGRRPEEPRKEFQQKLRRGTKSCSVRIRMKLRCLCFLLFDLLSARAYERCRS